LRITIATYSWPSKFGDVAGFGALPRMKANRRASSVLAVGPNVTAPNIAKLPELARTATVLLASVCFPQPVRPPISGLFVTIASSYKHLSSRIGGFQMARKSKRREWTASDVRTLKSLAKKKTRTASIARTLKRTTSATRQKASSLGMSLNSRA